MSAVMEFAGEEIVRRTLRYAARNPEQNLPTLLAWGERLASGSTQKEAVRAVRRALEEPEGNWRRLTLALLKQTKPEVLERLAVNLFVRSFFLGVPRQQAAEKRLDANVPAALLIDPTSRCNLRCTGCWAGDYRRTDDLELDLLRRILDEARPLGVHLIVVSGGEPLVRKGDLLTWAREYPDFVFHVFTNGTLLDREFAAGAAEAGNLMFAFSVEGLAQNTDARRGRGVYDKVLEAMALLREVGVPFGFSATYTRHNVPELSSDAFIDAMVEQGCCFGWFFTYLPVGSDVDLDLMATPAQRAEMYRAVRRFRQTKPIFLADFWNDGEAVQGCIAGGRRYLHINAAGEVEPCAFIHYATHNIRNCTLEEALASPLFQAYRARQPFNQNHLRPCPLLDNPDALPEMVRTSGAHPTQLHLAEPGELARQLHPYAEEWGRQADGLVRENDRTPGDAGLKQGTAQA
ncbi:MAG: radical SAM protein [Bacillota bacterium]|nr:radical SAM protein [Bacillota bacterium]